MKTIGEYFESSSNNFMLMRLIASMLVIYGHCYPIMGSGKPDVILDLLQMQYAGGLALDIFFIMSGFLIARSFELNSHKEFIISRCLRIFPGLIVCVLLTTFILGGLLTSDDNYYSSPQTLKYFINNASLWGTEYFLPSVFDGNADRAMNGSLWSLYIEFRLYFLLFFFGLLSLLKESRYFWLCVLIGLLSYYVLPDLATYGLHKVRIGFGILLMAIVFWIKYPKQFVWIVIAAIFYFIFYTPVLPVLSLHDDWLKASAFFAAGTFIWVYRNKINLSYPALALFLLLGVAFRKTNTMPIMYFIGLIYLTFFIALVVQLPRIKKIDLSYGIYLYGWPIQQVVASKFPQFTPEMNALVSIFAAAFFAYFSWTLIESPCMRLKSKILKIQFGAERRIA